MLPEALEQQSQLVLADRGKGGVHSDRRHDDIRLAEGRLDERLRVDRSSPSKPPSRGPSRLRIRGEHALEERLARLRIAEERLDRGVEFSPSTDRERRPVDKRKRPDELVKPFGRQSSKNRLVR